MLIAEPTLEEVLALSTGYNSQGSMQPITIGGGSSLLSWKSGGIATGKMWLSFGWTAQTGYRPDGSTVSIAAPPAAPSAPTLSQVALGSNGARTLFARIALVRHSVSGLDQLYPVSAESSLAVNANNVLKITSPTNPGGYDGWLPLVGNATNAEYCQVQGGPMYVAFGTDWTEPSTGFATTNSQYDNTNWKSLTLINLLASITASVYPYLSLSRGQVEVAAVMASGGDAASARAQISDGNIPLSAFSTSLGGYYFQVTIPAAAGSMSGSGGGSRWV